MKDPLDSNRVSANDRPDIQITRKMIDAGVARLNDFEYNNWIPNRMEAVKAIYVAMRSLALS